jgi:hypothetical protein
MSDLKISKSKLIPHIGSDICYVNINYKMSVDYIRAAFEDTNITDLGIQTYRDATVTWISFKEYRDDRDSTLTEYDNLVKALFFRSEKAAKEFLYAAEKLATFNILKNFFTK